MALRRLMMKQICIMEPLGISKEQLESIFHPIVERGYSLDVHMTKESDEKALYDRIKDASILVLANQPLSGSIIRRCSKLEMISIAFTGVDHVDIKACEEKGIAVSNAAGYSTHAVSELVFGLAISLMRNIVPCDGRTRTAGTKDGLVGPELYGKTFGVIGMGAIGEATARIAKAFGCQVLAYNRSPKPKLEEEGFIFTDIDTICKKAHIVSLHVPLNDETHHLIDERRIGIMQQNAILINTARGPVVDMVALGDALRKGHLGGAGIDVYEIEPPIPKDHPLCTAPHTVLTPHIGFASQEAFITRAHIVKDNVLHWLEGSPINVIC